MTRLLNRAAWIESRGPMDPYHVAHRDMGIGIYRLTTEGAALDDSLVFRSAPTFSAPPVAVFRSDTVPEGWRIAKFLAADSIAVNITEFRYETAGIAVDSVTPDKQWAHTIFGFTPGGRARAGWLPLTDSSRVEWWSNLLLEFENLEADSTLRIFEHPGTAGPGERVPWENYDIRSDTIAGDWMRVKIQVPGDHCEDKAKAPQTWVRWIRWRDTRGCPTLSYWPRGC